jgi:hypothetical protein
LEWNSGLSNPVDEIKRQEKELYGRFMARGWSKKIKGKERGSNLALTFFLRCHKGKMQSRPKMKKEEQNYRRKNLTQTNLFILRGATGLLHKLEESCRTKGQDLGG